MKKRSWLLASLLVFFVVIAACTDSNQKGTGPPIQATVLSSGNATANIDTGKADAEAFAATVVEESLGLAWSVVEGEASIGGDGQADARTETSTQLEINAGQQGSHLLVNASSLAGFLTSDGEKAVGEVIVVDESLGDAEENLAESGHFAEVAVEAAEILTGQLVHSSLSKRESSVLLDIREESSKRSEAGGSMNALVTASNGRFDIIGEADTHVTDRRARSGSDVRVVVSSRGRASAEASSEIIVGALDQCRGAQRATTGSASFSADEDVDGLIHVSSNSRANRDSGRAFTRARSMVSGKNAAVSSSVTSSSTATTK